MTRILSENSKMQHTNEVNEDFKFMDFGISARITCSQAGECARYCYATRNRYKFSNVMNAMEYRMQLTFQPFFFELMNQTIREEVWKLHGRKKLVIRIHSSGDFGYQGNDRPEYFDTWVKIARANPDVIFYTYTKCIKMVKDYKKIYSIPENFSITFSWGGKLDSYIEPDDKQARVIMKGEEIEDGWMDATGNDMIPILYKKVALPYH